MRRIPWLVSLAIIGTVFYLFWTSPDPAIRPRIQKTGTELTASLRNTKLFDYQGKNVTWIVNSESVDLYENQKSIHLKKINGKATSARSGGRPTFFKADHGRIRSNSKQMVAWGNVEIEFTDGEKLMTARVIIDQKKELIYNHTPVRIVSNSDTIHADSMHYSFKSDLLTLTHPKVKLLID